MLKKERNKGITLIALIITIIVLLILAGVTISAITGNESVMEKAKEAKEKQEASTELEQFQLAYISAIADLEKTSITAQELEDYLNNNLNMNVLVDEQQFYHDSTSGRYWAYKSLYSSTDLQNVEHFRNNDNANIVLGTYKIISNLDTNVFYIADSKGKIEEFNDCINIYKLNTGETPSERVAIGFNDVIYVPEGYEYVKFGYMLSTNKMLGYTQGATIKLNYDLDNIMKFSDNSYTTINSSVRQYGFTDYYDYSLNWQPVDSNTTAYIYYRDYLILKKQDTDEKIIFYDKPVSVTYNQIQALEQGN